MVQLKDIIHGIVDKLVQFPLEATRSVVLCSFPPFPPLRLAPFSISLAFAIFCLLPWPIPPPLHRSVPKANLVVKHLFLTSRDYGGS